ncbi:MAG: hypothetical protein JXB26_11675 [Candidatus Aminicenantes bacterium]|nr:hypothetical protein [Candidatus Aminicenantes bacterium]
MNSLKKRKRHLFSKPALSFLIFFLAVSSSPKLHPQVSGMNYLGEQRRLINNFYGRVASTCRTSADFQAAWEVYVARPLRALDPRRLADVNEISRQANAPFHWSAGRAPTDPGFRPGGDYDLTFSSQGGYYRTMRILNANNIPYHENYNSFTAPSLNYTGHMPDPAYELPTERPWTRTAMAADPEAASHFGLSGRTMAIPVYEATSGRMVLVQNPLPNNPFTPLGDLAKKNQEALAMINKPGATMFDVHEAANFASKAAGKGYDVMKQNRLTKYVRPNQRLSNPQIAERLSKCGSDVNLAKSVVRDMINQSGKELIRYSNLALRQVGQLAKKIQIDWVRAMERGDIIAADKIKAQLNELRSLMKESSARLGNESAYRAVFGRDQSSSLGRPVSPEAKFGPVKPQMSTLQNVLNKGMAALEVINVLHAVYRGSQREIEDARREGRDTEVTMFVLKSLDEFLGISYAWETGRREGEKTMAAYLERAMREGRDLSLLEKIKAKLESLCHAYGEFTNLYALGHSYKEGYELVKASLAEVDAKIRQHKEWLKLLEKKEGKTPPKKPGISSIPSPDKDLKKEKSIKTFDLPEAERDKSRGVSTVKVSDVVVSPASVEPGKKINIAAGISGRRVADMIDLDLSCLVDGRLVDSRTEGGQRGGFDFSYHVSYEVPDNVAAKTYKVQVSAVFRSADELFEQKDREAARSSGEGAFEVTGGLQVAWVVTFKGSVTIDRVYPWAKDGSVEVINGTCNNVLFTYYPYGVPSVNPNGAPRNTLPFSGKSSYVFLAGCVSPEDKLVWKETYRYQETGELWTSKRKLSWINLSMLNPDEMPWTGHHITGRYELQADMPTARIDDPYFTYDGVFSPDFSSGQGVIIVYKQKPRADGHFDDVKLFDGRWHVKRTGEEYVTGTMAEKLLEKFGRK